MLPFKQGPIPFTPDLDLDHVEKQVKWNRERREECGVWLHLLPCSSRKEGRVYVCVGALTSLSHSEGLPRFDEPQK